MPPHRPATATSCLLALAVSLLAAPGLGMDLFVAPDGSDAHDGSRDRPLATLQRARDTIRAMKRSRTLSGPVQVWLAGGVYRLNEPIVFTAADTGTAESPISYASVPGERAIISGGTVLQGTWSQTPGKPYWQLDVPEARTSGRNFHSLYVDGQSRTRARHPNYGDKVLRAEGRDPAGDPRQALRYMPADVDPDWSHPTDIDVVLLCSWTPTIHRLREIDAARRVIRFHSTHSRPVDFWERNFRYYLSNFLEALDEPGEWYLNRHTGTLYYYPLPGEDIHRITLTAPVLKSTVLRFDCDLDAGETIEHLHFRDLSFQCVDGDMDRHDGVYRQGHMYLDAAITARGLRNASFLRCEFTQLGEYAMELADGCRDVAVRQCHFWDLGAGAIQLGVSDLASLKKGQPSDTSKGNPRRADNLLINNNCIHRLGTVWHGCYGIVNRFASHTRITHNEIYDTHWDAIGLDARWNWTGPHDKYSHGNEVAYNHLHHLGLGYQTDAAGIYQFGPLDTHIHHNLIHDTIAYPYICGFAGIYLDQQSRGAVVENNLVYNVDWFAYFQHKGTDNVFRNNIGAFARDGFISRGGLNEQWRSNHMQATRNIYVTDTDIAIGRDWEPGDKPPVLSRNIYYSLAKDASLSFAGRTFEQWQAEGHDQDSLVGDPGLRAPAQYDFSLPADAMACQRIEFVPLDQKISQAGLTGDAAWCNLPLAYPPRHRTATWEQADFARLAAFHLDFNQLSDGAEPGVFSATAPAGSGFHVTSEIAGTRGARCLKCTDRTGLAKSFYPYLHLSPRGLQQGNITFRFAVRQPRTQPARLHLEFRGKGQTREPGPSISIDRDGSVDANGQRVMKLSPEQWTHFELRFALGDQATGSYVLKIRDSQGESTHELPCGRPTFDQIAWLGFSAPDDSDGVIYLDDIQLAIDD